jgi:hypothetical protein
MTRLERCGGVNVCCWSLAEVCDGDIGKSKNTPAGSTSTSFSPPPKNAYPSLELESLSITARRNLHFFFQVNITACESNSGRTSHAHPSPLYSLISTRQGAENSSAYRLSSARTPPPPKSDREFRRQRELSSYERQKDIRRADRGLI